MASTKLLLEKLEVVYLLWPPSHWPQCQVYWFQQQAEWDPSQCQGYWGSHLSKNGKEWRMNNVYVCVCVITLYIKCIKYIFILLKKRRYRQLKMYRFYCSGFSQMQTEVWRDVSNLFFLFLFMLTVSTVNSSLPQSVVWSVVFISWAVLECCVKPWLVLPSLLRCCGGGRGAQPLWEHEPRLDEAPKLLQNC